MNNSKLGRLVAVVVLIVSLAGCGEGPFECKDCHHSATGPSTAMDIMCAGIPTLATSATSVAKGTIVVITGTGFPAGEVTWHVSGWDPNVVRPKSPVTNCVTSWTYNTGGDVVGTTRQIYAVASDGRSTNLVAFTIR